MDWKKVFISRLLGLFIIAGLTLAQELSLSPDVTQIVEFANKSSLFITCRGDRAEQIIWIKPSGDQISDDTDQRIHVERRNNGREVDLMFENIKKKDVGEYTCSAVMNGRAVTRKFRLIVHKPITFVNDKVQYAKEGFDFLVRCDPKGDPKPEVSWKVKGARVQFRGGKYNKTDKGLVIKNVTRSDAGQYLCKAFQMTEKKSDWREKYIQVKVQHKPEWNRGHMEQAYSYVTGTVNLTCEAVAEPGATFEWIKDNETIDENSENINIVNELNKSVLQITVTNSSIFGSYVCKATNTVGTMERVIILQKGAKPGVPSFRITKTDSTTMTLSITGPQSDALMVIGYKVQYKMAKQDWSKAKENRFLKGSTYKVIGLQQNTPYTVRVAAQNAAGFGDFAPEIQQRTQMHTTGSAPRNQYWGVALLIQLCSLLAAVLTL